MTDRDSLRLEDFLAIEPVEEARLETPVAVVDLDRTERNIRRWQARCDAAGLANRPHVKTHKLAGMARFQLACGAAGITVQKLGEAEVMADAGITDMLITFNIVGAPKLERLAALARRTGIHVVADSMEVAAGIAEAGQQAGRPIEVLVETDSGAGRNGVQSAREAATLAARIAATPGLAYRGLMTYPPARGRAEVAAGLEAARAAVAAEGLETRVVSSGGSPDMWSDEGLAPVTEYRAGTYVFFDRSLIAAGAAAPEDCALTVAATVVSTPAPGRAILDAGSKALTSDLLGQPDYGALPGHGDARLVKLNEEHGYLDTAGLNDPPRVGDRVAVLPNHACPVINLYDRIAVARGGRILGLVAVDARGRVW